MIQRLVAGLLLGACTGSPVSLAPVPPPADAGWCTIYLRFEPALVLPAELQVQHEAGLRFAVTTGRAGVELRLPPGPASLQLRIGDTVVERLLDVRGGGEVVFATAR